MQLFAEQFTDISLGHPMFFGNLAVMPIQANPKNQCTNIKTFDELDALGLAMASEISENGSVNTIKVLNKSDAHLAIFDNDIITGAKQNRVAKSTVIVPPHDSIELPVYCVERGRWQYEDSRSFKRSEHSLSPLIREKKMMMMKAGSTANIQDEVWSDVDNLSEKLDFFSSTASFTEVVGKQHYKEEDELVAYIKNDNALGYAVMSGAKLFAEMFFNENTCRRQSLKSVKSWFADVGDNKICSTKKQELIKEEIINSRWHSVNGIGAETAYEASGLKHGQTVLLEDRFVHGLIYL